MPTTEKKPSVSTFQAGPNPAPWDKGTTWDTIVKNAKKNVDWGEWDEKKPKPVEDGNTVLLLKVGADIEEFLRDKNGKPVPVIGLIGGTKEEPMPILTELGKGFALQEDNVALEYNIPAAADKFSWVYNLMRIREEINARVAKHGLVPAIEASMRFDASQLEHPQAKVFGCEPDFNVWEQTVNEKPSAHPDSATLRTAGGHVHVSFTIGGKTPDREKDLAMMEAIIMSLDIHLGVPFTIIDKDTERRKLYGKAGAFRFKEEYNGLEYRVLSSYWTRSPVLMAYVYGGVVDAIRYVNRYDTPRSRLIQYKDMVYGAINEGKMEFVEHLMSKFHIPLPAAIENQ